MNHLRRMVSFLLVLVLCFGLIPGVSAAEVDTPGADTQTEATETEETTPTTVDTQPTEELPPETESESTEPPSADVPMEEPGFIDAIFTGASVMSIASTQNSIMLFDYADNGNYTTVLNSQVTCHIMVAVDHICFFASAVSCEAISSSSVSSACKYCKGAADHSGFSVFYIVQTHSVNAQGKSWTGEMDDRNHRAETHCNNAGVSRFTTPRHLFTDNRSSVFCINCPVFHTISSACGRPCNSFRFYSLDDP